MSYKHEIENKFLLLDTRSTAPFPCLLFNVIYKNNPPNEAMLPAHPYDDDPCATLPSESNSNSEPESRIGDFRESGLEGAGGGGGTTPATDVAEGFEERTVG